MKAILAILTTILAVASAGIHHGYGHGHTYAHVAHVPVAPVVHVAKVPIATSYQHEHRTYHHVVPVVKAIPVVQPVIKYVQQPIVHHVPVHHGYHGHGHGHGYQSVGYNHGFTHYGGHHY